MTSNLSPKSIFLTDGLGALLSAFFLGVILVQFEDIIGMPKNILYVLSLLACLFAMYSISCHFLLKTAWRPYLKAIAWANLLYCALTIACVFFYYQHLTALGLTYFVLELIIVAVLIRVEFTAAYDYLILSYK